MKNLFKLTTLATAFVLSANSALANDKIGFADPNYLLQNHPVMVEAAKKIEQLALDIKNKYADEEKKLKAEDAALTEEYKKIEADFKKFQQDQVVVEASLKKKIEALEKEAPRLRAKEIQARQKAINNEQNAFQAKFVALQNREAEFYKKTEAFQKKATEFQQKVEKEQKNTGIDANAIQQQALNDINNAIKKVADAKGYTVVFPPSAALYAKDEKNADLTDSILSELKATVKVPALQAK